MATDLQKIILAAIPAVACPVDMQNIIARRIWLEKEIIKLYDEQRSLSEIQQVPAK